MKLKKKKVGIYMATITIERDGLNLVGTREEPFGEIYDMAIIFHGFTANRNTPLQKKLLMNYVMKILLVFVLTLTVMVILMENSKT